MYFQNFFIFGSAIRKKSEKCKKNCHTDVAERNENSCHDMDVANCLKFTKNFFLITEMPGTAMERWRSQPLD